MYYENTITGEFGFTIGHVRQTLPHMSIPEGTLEVGNFKAYQPVPSPILEWNQNVSEGAPVNGRQTWVVVTAPAEELQARIAIKANQVRQDREPLLTACDWTQLADAPLTTEQVQAWRDYRQALRDVSDQPGFPWTIIWPTRPETV